MEFKAIKKSQEMKSNYTSALESIEGSHTIDIEGESMKLSLLTDKIIEGNNLKEVTNPTMFKSVNVPTEDGLFSNTIFGDTPNEKKRTHAYIDLHRKFFHPYIYEIIVRMQRNIDLVASGQGAWYITPDGKLERVIDESDSRYNEENTGIPWLVENFRKISFKETGSKKREKTIKLLNSLSDDEIFISKWIVIPVLYRDVSGTGKKTIPEINNKYSKLLSDTRSYENDLLFSTKYITLYRIQTTLVEIRKMGQALLEKKKGAIQKSVLGKAIDYGARGVISVPSLVDCDTPSDCIVDIVHSGIPLSKCIEAAQPFLMKWVLDFFDDLFRNRHELPICRKNKKGEYEFEYVEIKDQNEVFTESFIQKKFEMFDKSFGFQRFETIKIPCKDGSEAELFFPGKGYGRNPGDPRANTIANRPMTWTDVFYLAAVNTLSDKYCYVTRYPLEHYFNIFPTKVAVLSTIKTAPVIIDGIVYPHYPVIDLSLTEDEIARVFIDTISVSNLYLDAIGGDYDGDTVSLKILFSIEANKEAEQQLNDIKHYLTVKGDLVRVLSNETYLSFYNMTRRE